MAAPLPSAARQAKAPPSPFVSQVSAAARPIEDGDAGLPHAARPNLAIPLTSFAEPVKRETARSYGRALRTAPLGSLGFILKNQKDHLTRQTSHPPLFTLDRPTLPDYDLTQLI